LTSGEIKDRRRSSFPVQTRATWVDAGLGAAIDEVIQEEARRRRSIVRRWREVEDEVVRRGEKVKLTVQMGYL
jgi:hypothetical protein